MNLCSFDRGGVVRSSWSNAGFLSTFENEAWMAFSAIITDFALWKDSDCHILENKVFGLLRETEETSSLVWQSGPEISFSGPS